MKIPCLIFLNKDEINKKRQKYRDENRDEINKKSRERYSAHKDEINELRKSIDSNTKILEKLISKLEGGVKHG